MIRALIGLIIEWFLDGVPQDPEVARLQARCAQLSREQFGKLRELQAAETAGQPRS